MTTLVYIFLYAPIIVLVILSFNSSRFSTIWQRVHLALVCAGLERQRTDRLAADKSDHRIGNHGDFHT